ncbi:patatin-like phospholipase family protein [Azospirillum doebereinerae]|uniref:patatin-like phospholipase family protein n=1 Tax=Azospirillum doebereinerae TaxID=92933 RepID=UPI001EE58A8F|nr:patatin-like phospholipase family protein [Azospirillum doebereinerae]MCG5240385.1 patatin-like phospholipase family protein [Azospirillum doebereinerae]
MAKLAKLWGALRRRPGGAGASVPVPPQPTPASPRPPMDRPKTRLALALQGGGAHGAFTWGVLDRLLEEESLDIAGVSGASAGAMNAAILVQGWARGGRHGARAELDRFWEKVSAAGRLGPIQPTLTGRMFGRWNVDNAPGTHLVEWARRWITPYQIQSADFHPLRALLGEVIEPALIKGSGLRLFVSATNVRTGGLTLFDETQVGVDHLLASACLPHLFRAVRIDGQDYWDGGYVANPAVFPLIAACPGVDIAVVTINPLTSPDTPEEPGAIAARLSQITFNAPLVRELRALMACGAAPRLHLIDADAELGDLGVYSKMMTDWAFLSWLREAGRKAGDRWVESHLGAVGVETTLRSAAFA